MNSSFLSTCTHTHTVHARSEVASFALFYAPAVNIYQLIRPILLKLHPTNITSQIRIGQTTCFDIKHLTTAGEVGYRSALLHLFLGPCHCLDLHPDRTRSQIVLHNSLIHKKNVSIVCWC